MNTIRELSYTAVLTSFNAEETLKRAVFSILEQGLEAKQIFIIDDASLDNSLEVANNLSQLDQRISVISNDCNQGQSFSRNLGASLSSSDFVVFFDDDDFSDPCRAAEHSRMFRGGAAISFVSSVIDYSNGYVAPATNSNFAGPIKIEELTQILLLGKDGKNKLKYLVPASTMAVTTKAFKEFGGFDPTLRRLEDVDLAIKFAQNNQVFAFSEKNLVTRFSTRSADKGSGIDMKYEEVLLRRYREFFSEIHFSHSLIHCRTRQLYFSKKIGLLFWHLLRNPRYSFRVLFRERIAFGRIVHDLRRRFSL